jgi:multidrug efflux system outer membrane protein
VEIEEARTRQLLFFYENTVLTAYREVEDSLVAVETLKRQVEAVDRQARAARNARELSKDRYDQGITSYLEVLDLQRSSFDSRLKASQTLQLQLTSTVTLYQALGGGWVPAQDSIQLNY